MSKYVGLLTAAGLACLPVMASAAPTLTEVLGASGVTLDGYISGSYQTGFNSGNNLNGIGAAVPPGAPAVPNLRTFDRQGDSFTLNQAAISISKLPAQGAGAFVNVIVGDDASVINGAYGDGDDKINVTQAYLQYATGGLTVIGGRFVTLAGAEVINDTANANISRGFLFTLVQPLVHTGVRSSYKMGGATLYLGASNSAFNTAGADADEQKTLELGVSLAPSASSSVALVGYHGTDSALGQEDTLIDLVASVQASPTLQLVLNADYRSTDFDAAGLEEQKIWGLAGYANFKLSDKSRASLRVEHVDVSDLSGTAGADQDVQSYTATYGYQVATNLELLGEVRWDNADDPIFAESGTAGDDSQGDVAIKAIYKF